MSSRLLLPTATSGGSQVWAPTELLEFVARLQQGDSTIGWEGDERLVLMRRKDGIWLIQRLGEDGKYHLVVRAKHPGAKLGNEVLIQLRDNDMRKQSADEFLARMDQENKNMSYKRDLALDDASAEATERVYHAAKKDIGHLY